jgi:hypothetical protein
VVLLLLAGCGGGPTTTGSFAEVVRAGHPREVTVTGTVQQLLPDSHGAAGRHERFVILVGDVSVEIDHNVTLAPRAPVQVGDRVTVHGQFEPDPGHPVIHYTHHATGRHEGGFLKLHGRTYAAGRPEQRRT